MTSYMQIHASHMVCSNIQEKVLKKNCTGYLQSVNMEDILHVYTVYSLNKDTYGDQAD